MTNPPSTKPAALLASLEERIKTQLGFEYHFQEQVDYEFENMTVPQLLHMLSYIFKEDELK